MLQIIDMITSMLQSIAFPISILYCTNEQIEKNKLKIIIVGFVLFVIGIYFTNNFGNLSICVFITHILSLLSIIILFRKHKVEAIIGYSITYSLIAALVILCNNIFYGIASELLNPYVLNIFKIISIYASQIMLMSFIFIRKRWMQDVFTIINNELKNRILLVITSFVLDCIVASNLIIYEDESGVKKSITILIICILFTTFVSYFAKVKQRSDEVLKLNKALEEKNKELRKIKHDYGAQISYLYGLHLMKRFDELGTALKNIINNNNSVDSAVKINESNNVLLSLATQNALDEGIHVIINDKCSLKKIDMDEMELYRIIKNIVNNAVKAMNGDGIIKLDTFEYMNNIVIRISNNGPKIPEENLTRIFEAGFTTKDNSDGGHGFGLSIVKELVESHNGKIFVKSTDVETEFKIVFQYVTEN